MAERQRKPFSRLKIARIQVALLLLLLLIIGFVAGRCSLPKQAQEPVAEVATTTTEARRASVITEPPITYYNVPLPEELQEYIILLCEKEDVPVPLIMAMIEQESAFNAEVISQTNDYGLMQINEVNHQWLSDLYSVTDFLDPYQNVYCGVSLIGGYLKEYGNETQALMCYNMGEYGASKLWDKGVNSSYYSRVVLSKMIQYEEGGNANGVDG